MAENENEQDPENPQGPQPGGYLYEQIQAEKTAREAQSKDPAIVGVPDETDDSERGYLARQVDEANAAAEAAKANDAGSQEYVREDLEELKVDDLQVILHDRDLPVSGNKAELIDRILGE